MDLIYIFFRNTVRGVTKPTVPRTRRRK